MKKSLWAVASFMLTFALADFIVFDWWLPQRFRESLKREMDGGQLVFEDIELDWWEGRMVGGALESPNWKLVLGEGRFSYSFLDWLLGNKLEVQHLELRDFRVTQRAKVEDFDLQESTWHFLNDLRIKPINFFCDSIDVSGNFEMGFISLPFSFFASQIESKNEIKSALEFRLNKRSLLIERFFPVNTEIFLKAIINKEIRDEKHILKVSVLADDFFKLNFVNDGESELISLNTDSDNKKFPSSRVSVARKKGDTKFKGDWNSTMTSANLVRYFPILSLVNAKIDGGGKISFDLSQEEIDLWVTAHFSASSVFFPKEGIINGEIQGQLSFMKKEWSSDEFNILLENHKGERIELQMNDSLKNSLNLSPIDMILTDFELGRFDRHFLKGAKINGIFRIMIKEGILNLDSNELSYRDNLVEQEKISLSLQFPVDQKNHKEEGIEFELEVASDNKIFTDFLPRVIKQKNPLFLHQIRAQGTIKSSGWFVQDAYTELISSNGRIGEIKLKNLSLSVGQDQTYKWSKVKSSNNHENFIIIDTLDTNFSLGIQNLNFINSFKDLNGTIIFENGRPKLLCENFILNGRYDDLSINLSQLTKINGDLIYDPSFQAYDQFIMKNFKFMGEEVEWLAGEISFTLNEHEKVTGLKSNNLDINLTALRYFGLPEFLNFQDKKLELNKLEWQLDGGSEVKLDGLIHLHNPNALGFYEIPVNWTFSEKNEEISHWVQLSYKKDMKSDLEINFQSESNFTSFSGQRLNIVDISLLIKNFLIRQPHQEKINVLNLFNQFKLDASFTFKTLILIPMIEFTDFEANYDHLRRIFSFNFMLDKSSIEGKLYLNFLDHKLSKFPSFKLVMEGRETNATVLNGVVESNFLLDGLINWELKADGMFNDNFETEITSDFTDISLNLFGDTKIGHELLLKNQMENSLGDSFSWSAPQSEMIEVLSNLLETIQLEQGSFELNRNNSGQWNFFLRNWKGSNLNFFGNGEISPEGNWKINFFPSVNGMWADFLEVANMLSAGKVRSGYRTLRQEPLIFEGSNNKWNLTNWWNFFAQGIGLKPSE